MNSRLNNVYEMVLLAALTGLALVGCGQARPEDAGTVSHPDFISFGPTVQGLTGQVKKPELRICLTGIDAGGTEWQSWEANIKSVVLKWVDSLRPVASSQLTQTVSVTGESPDCDGSVRVVPGTWSNTSIGEKPVVSMDRTGYFASYNVLLHEFGHAFALSDTYQGGQSGNCQPGQPQAVMCNTSFDAPQPDDVQGIQSVFKRIFPNG